MMGVACLCEPTFPEGDGRSNLSSNKTKKKVGLPRPAKPKQVGKYIRPCSPRSTQRQNLFTWLEKLICYPELRLISYLIFLASR